MLARHVAGFCLLLRQRPLASQLLLMLLWGRLSAVQVLSAHLNQRAAAYILLHCCVVLRAPCTSVQPPTKPQLYVWVYCDLFFDQKGQMLVLLVVMK